MNEQEKPRELSRDKILDEMSKNRAFLVNIETVHGLKLTELGREMVDKRIEKLDEEWEEINERKK